MPWADQYKGFTSSPMMPKLGQNLQAYPQAYAARSAPAPRVDPWQAAWNQARTANEARYQQILGGYNALGAKSMAVADQMGRGQRAEINRRFDAQQGGSMQDLVDRGLRNSTTAPSVKAGIERQRGYALNDLSDQVTQQKLGVLGRIGQAELDFAERRNDVYPDYGQMAGLYAGAGAYGQRGPQYVAPAMYGYGMPQFSIGGGYGQRWSPSPASMATQAARRAMRNVRLGPTVVSMPAVDGPRQVPFNQGPMWA